MSTAADLLESLERLSARGRLIAGICVTLAGIGLTYAMWESGLVWAFSLSLLFIGVGLIASGLGGLRKERAEHAQWARIEEEEDAIVAALRRATRGGARRVPWLIQQGFTDRKARAHLLERADEAGPD